MMLEHKLRRLHKTGAIPIGTLNELLATYEQDITDAESSAYANGWDDGYESAEEDVYYRLDDPFEE